ncbi:tripartite tricarboxylate transporter TctB family protein [Falsiroseomonas sp. CW058]|uniref:tripartite tricarboxylate transporter TctB family protein n=1 Tax=Falsiroseomonas sp. CW058 TaxID=3388664 RepID=UPI003D31CB97
MKASTAPLRGGHGNRIAAGLVAAAACLAFAGTYWFDPVPPGLPGLGAVEFPRLICAVLLGLSVLLFLQEPGPAAEEAPRLAPGLPIYAACLLFLPAMGLVGLLGAIAAFMVAAGWLWGERRLPLLLAVSGGFTLSLWIVFVKVFRLTLPGGLLFGN